MLYNAKTLSGYKLRSFGEDLGKTKEFYFDDKHWTIRYLVADTGNWLIGRQILISPYALVEVNKEDEYIKINLTKKQIEDSPSLEYDKPVSRQFERSYFEYYEWATYWDGQSRWGYNPDILPDNKQWKESIKEEKESWDSQLRSTNEVSGYNIQANDGDIGHVVDFIVDEETWAIRYLIIDTKNWWSGKKVLISPQWIERVSWNDSKVFVNLSREIIKQAPEYIENNLLKRDYEDELHQYYKRQGYWIDENAARGH